MCPGIPGFFYLTLLFLKLCYYLIVMQKNNTQLYIDHMCGKAHFWVSPMRGAASTDRLVLCF